MGAANKYRQHLVIIPEDDPVRQMAVGFRDSVFVRSQLVEITKVAGGWGEVLSHFRETWLERCRRNSNIHLVMLIDFDGFAVTRRDDFEDDIPPELRSRVVVIGWRGEAEGLRRAMRNSFERIGAEAARGCSEGSLTLWEHELLRSNVPTVSSFHRVLRDFLFL